MLRPDSLLLGASLIMLTVGVVVIIHSLLFDDDSGDDVWPPSGEFK